MFDWLLSLFSKLCKKPSANTTPKSASESTQHPKAESKPADKIVAPAEAAAPPASEKITATPESVQPASQAVEVENIPVAQPINKVAASTENSDLPQDSMLRRHYLTNLHAIKDAPVVIATTPDTQTISEEPQTIVAKEEAQTIIEPVTEKSVSSENVGATSHKVSKIPQDSALRRHYVTHLYAEVQANLPARPTDSSLRRHYDAMLESKVNKQLTE